MFQWLLYPFVFPSSFLECKFLRVYLTQCLFLQLIYFFRAQSKSGSRLLRSICLLRLRDLLAVMNPTWPWDRSDGGEIALVRILRIFDHSRPSLLWEPRKSIFLFSLPSSSVMMFQTGKFVFLCFFMMDFWWCNLASMDLYFFFSIYPKNSDPQKQKDSIHQMSTSAKVLFSLQILCCELTLWTVVVRF